MSNEIDIRQIHMADVGKLVALRRESLENEALAFGSSLEDDVCLSLEFMRDALTKEQEQAVFGQFDESELTGMIGLFRNSKLKRRHRAVIWGMYVAPQARNKGVGRALLEAAIHHAKSWGIEQLHLSVTDAAQSAKDLYETAGFLQWGIERRSLQWEGRFVDEHHLVLELG